MKKSVAILAVVLLLINGCTSKKKKELIGIWKLTTLEVNGTVLQGESLGNWLWEFNDEGGYMHNVAGIKEKGRYTLGDKKLTLKSVTYKDKAEQEYNIIRLDSTQLDLRAISDKNPTTLHFIKTAGEIEVD